MALGRVVRRGDQVEQAVVVEVLHDRAAGLVEAVDPNQLADVAELADVELRVLVTIQRDEEPRIDLVGMFAQGHVGQVEQPADLQVVGELLEVLGEVADRQAGAGRIGVHGGRRDRQDARAFAPAHDAVLVLAAAQRGHTLEINDGVKEFPLQAIHALDERSGLLQDFVAPVGLSLVIEQQRLGHQHGGDLAMVPGTPGVFQGSFELRDQLVPRLPPGFTDLLQRGAGLPGLERCEDHGEPADVHGFVRTETRQGSPGGTPVLHPARRAGTERRRRPSAGRTAGGLGVPAQDPGGRCDDQPQDGRNPQDPGSRPGRSVRLHRTKTLSTPWNLRDRRRQADEECIDPKPLSRPWRCRRIGCPSRVPGILRHFQHSGWSITSILAAA